MNLRSLAPFGVALIWGVNIPVMKGAIGQLDAYAFNTFRLTLSALLLAAMDRHTARGRVRAPLPWRVVVPLGLLVAFFYQLLFLGGMGRTSAGHTAVLIGSGPFWTAILGRLTGMEHPSARAWLGLALAFCGTIAVVSDPAGGATLVGDALVLGAAIAWASGTLWSKRALEGIDPLRLAAAMAVVALPFHWLVAWPRFSGEEVATLTPRFWGAVVYAGLLSTGVAQALWNVGLVTVGAARTAVYVNLVPVIATAIAWAVLGEAVGLRQAGGALAVIGGLLLVQRARIRAG